MVLFRNDKTILRYYSYSCIHCDTTIVLSNKELIDMKYCFTSLVEKPMKRIGSGIHMITYTCIHCDTVIVANKKLNDLKYCFKHLEDKAMNRLALGDAIYDSDSYNIDEPYNS